MIIAGFAIDGKKGFISREHEDIDVLCAKEDKRKVEELIIGLEYNKEKYNDLYKLKNKKGVKDVDLCLVSEEGDFAVTYGKIAITKFPKKLFDNPQIGRLGDLKFKIAQNELLKTWGQYSKKEDDVCYVKRLKADEKIMKKIKRELRK